MTAALAHLKVCCDVSQPAREEITREVLRVASDLCLILGDVLEVLFNMIVLPEPPPPTPSSLSASASGKKAEGGEGRLVLVLGVLTNICVFGETLLKQSVPRKSCVIAKSHSPTLHISPVTVNSLH